jgi:DNA-binding GntR family transcriptional regulator
MKTSGKTRYTSIQDSVYAALHDSIINLNLEPGTAISEKEIAQRFEVSRTPVREAFIHLSNEGLVEVIPQKETRVSLIDLGRVDQEFFLRESLEKGIQEPFMRKASKADFAELDDLLELQAGALKKNSFIDFINYDDRFHQIFFEAADQALSWNVLISMSGHYHRVRMLTIRLLGIADGKVKEHRNILQALKKKDLDKAKKTLYEHLHNLSSEETLLRSQFPDYFVSETVKNSFNVDFGGLPRIS